MSIRQGVAFVVALSCVALAGGARITAAQGTDPAKHAVVPAAEVKFGPIEVPGFPTGMKIAAIHGDPNAESGMYVIRLQFPAGYKFPAHWHPNAENLTVLSGELQLGMGDKEDATKLVSYKPGTFMYIPGKMPHFGGARGATVIQLHGQAPFKIELVKSAATQ
jgi:quercetin dioxygenase-like cupin family protein